MKHGISNVQERIDGYHATYTDRLGNSCAVHGTFAFGSLLSWAGADGHYYVISGSDQRRLVPTAETVRIKPA